MEARLLGEGSDTDFALLRAGAARHLPAATLGDSKRLRRGQLRSFELHPIERRGK